MPITTSDDEAQEYADLHHWRHVMEALFVPAIEAFGYEAVRPVAKGASMIHAEIVKNLESCDLVLCDLSSHNPNVFFELGVRTSLDKPVALVRDDRTEIPFDLGGVNAHEYSAALRGWELEDQRRLLADHLSQSAESCGESNPLWQTFGLTIRAQETDPTATPIEAALSTLSRELSELRAEMKFGAGDGDSLAFRPQPLTNELRALIVESVKKALRNESPMHGSRVKSLIVSLVGEAGYKTFLSNEPLNVALNRDGIPITTDDSGRFTLPEPHAEWGRDPLLGDAG